MVDQRTNLFGVKAPSMKPRPITKTELTDELFPGIADTIVHTISNEVIYAKVSMPQSDLSLVIDDYVTHNKKLGTQ